MAFNEILAQRIRERLMTDLPIEEKRMMGGLTFMVDGKMCVGILQDDLMARIDPAKRDMALTRSGCREMDFTGRPMKSFIFIGPEGTEHNEDLDFWLNLALEYNPIAKAAPKKKSKKEA